VFTDSYGNARFPGLYRGIVVANDDPISKGRLKLQIPQILGSSVTDWAWASRNPGAPEASPEIGSGVWVQFEGGDPSFPVWVGTFDSAATVGSVTGITAGTGIVASTGASPITTSGTLSLAALSPNPANTYGSSTAIPSITVDAYGRTTSVTTNSLNLDLGGASITGTLPESKGGTGVITGAGLVPVIPTSAGTAVTGATSWTYATTPTTNSFSFSAKNHVYIGGIFSSAYTHYRLKIEFTSASITTPSYMGLTSGTGTGTWSGGVPGNRIMTASYYAGTVYWTGADSLAGAETAASTSGWNWGFGVMPSITTLDINHPFEVRTTTILGQSIQESATNSFPVSLGGSHTGGTSADGLYFVNTSASQSLTGTVWIYAYNNV
jgi:hypothetical protein